MSPWETGSFNRPARKDAYWKFILSGLLAALVYTWGWTKTSLPPNEPKLTSTELARGLEACMVNGQRPFVDYSFAARRLSTLDSTLPVTIFQNATLINGDGNITPEIEIEIQGDIFTYVGPPREATHGGTSHGAKILDLGGRYVSPGLVDMHSHVGVRQEPQIIANEDVTETTSPVTSWARAIDGFKPTDDAIKILASGGVTTSLVLTGAKNLISGEGFVIKHKDTFSVWEMQIDSTSNGTSPKPQRYLKMACGENIKQQFAHSSTGPVSREGESGFVRFAYEEARELLGKQDVWCAQARSNPQKLDGPYPSSIHVQTLVDVLRGDVTTHIHCYQAQDVFSQFDHADEFGYNITALHHITQAHEFLDEIKKRDIVLATFSDEGGFKNENYLFSWHMLKRAADAGITIALTTDHPAKHGQFFAQEAQIGHHFELSEKLTMASITSVPAKTLGLDNRVGWIRPGFDADLVVWDSHPLTLGATPLHTMADGEVLVTASAKLWEASSKLETLLTPAPASRVQVVNNEDVCTRGQKDIVIRGIVGSFLKEASATGMENATAVIKNGVLQCLGGSSCEIKAQNAIAQGVPVMDLRNGFILPGLVSMTRSHGLSEMVDEPSTKDGYVSGDDLAHVATAADGLRFDENRLNFDHRRGLTTLITAPTSKGFLHGLSTAFRAGAAHGLDDGAIVKREVALQFSVGEEGKTNSFPTISSQISALRSILTGSTSSTDTAFAKAAKGTLPVVIRTDSKDVIAKIIALKMELPRIRPVIYGGGESHLLAQELADANIPVVLAPFRCSQLTWDLRNCIPGPPLTDEAGPDILMDAGVTLGVGIWDHRDRWVTNALWEASWLVRWRTDLSRGARRELAVQLVTGNMRTIFGLEIHDDEEFVVYEGDPLEYGASVALIVEQGKVQRCWPDVQ